MKRRVLFAIGFLLLALVGLYLWPNQKPASSASATSVAENAPAQEASYSASVPPQKKGVQEGGQRRQVYLQVESESHAPIGGAKVHVIAIGIDQAIETDSDGLAILENIPARVGRLSVQADGYLDQSLFQPKFPFKGDFSWTVSLKADNKTLDPDRRRIRGVVLSGGQPVAGASLFLDVKSGGASVDDKKMEVKELMGKSSGDGRFVMEVSRDLQVSAITAMHVAHGEVTEALKGNDEVTLVLPASAYVEGRVVDSHGKAIEKCFIAAAPLFVSTSKAYRVQSARLWKARRGNRRDIGIRRQMSDLNRLAQGDQYRLPKDQKKMGLSDDAAPGTFRLGPFAPGQLAIVGGSDAYEPDRQEIMLIEGETKTNLVLTLGEPLTVTGIVTNAKTGAPIARARVTATSIDRGVPGFGTTLSDADGQYRLVTSSGARQTLTVKARGYFSLDSGGIEGRAGETAERDFALSPKGRGKASRHKRQYVGIGAQLKQTEDGALVVRVLGNGAAKDFLDAGDVITRVDGQWIENQPLRDTVQSILGEPDSDVELEVRRAGQTQSETVVIPRKRVTTSLR